MHRLPQGEQQQRKPIVFISVLVNFYWFLSIKCAFLHCYILIGGDGWCSEYWWIQSISGDSLDNHWQLINVSIVCINAVLIQSTTHSVGWLLFNFQFYVVASYSISMYIYIVVLYIMIHEDKQCIKRQFTIFFFLCLFLFVLFVFCLYGGLVCFCWEHYLKK